MARSETTLQRQHHHNLTGMADAAGIYMHLWRPEELKITLASELIEPLRGDWLGWKPSPKIGRTNAPNGWGKYEHFVPFVRNYLRACENSPTATVSVSVEDKGADDGDVTINGAAAPYRRDLRGADLAYEFCLYATKLRPGDTLIIPEQCVRSPGPDHEVSPPPYPHTRWRDARGESLCAARWIERSLERWKIWMRFCKR